ncbi:hypothetical protein [Chitinimonas sp. BJB300]|uniref:hypothetical protein n=1 Tax=Chitinimonas sp. BJB300 TaxID=1559339 RepID=UPI001111C72B|nr:hypothetical protein [Chitinimonas sp. BJB300]TSJ85250.1 hypothetical protein FG002_017710 [Chitinimonas sp. BJB300]
MQTISTLTMTLMRRLESLLSKRASNNLAKSRSIKRHRADGVCLPSNHMVQQGAPVYLPAQYL